MPLIFAHSARTAQPHDATYRDARFERGEAPHKHPQQRDLYLGRQSNFQDLERHGFDHQKGKKIYPPGRTTQYLVFRFVTKQDDVGSGHQINAKLRMQNAKLKTKN